MNIILFWGRWNQHQRQASFFFATLSSPRNDNDLTLSIGVQDYFSGPCYCYFKTPHPDEIPQAHDLINEIIAEEGPFDGVLGFSQGATVAASLLLQHAIDHPDTAPPFKFAVFFSSYFAFSSDYSFQQDAAIAFAAESTKARASSKTGMNQKTLELLELQSAPLGFSPSVVLDFSAALKTANRTGLAGRVDYTELSPDQYPRPFHPDLLARRITIPTAHIYSSEDPFNVSARLLQKMCAGKVVKGVIHGGGHELPRTKGEIKAAKVAVECVIDESRLY